MAKIPSHPTCYWHPAGPLQRTYEARVQCDLRSRFCPDCGGAIAGVWSDEAGDFGRKRIPVQF